MGLFITILVGIIAGYVTAKLMKIDVSFWIAMLLGIAGSIVGGWVTSLLLGVNLASGFNLTTILVSVGGAVLVVLIYRLLKKK
jgi:Transglycosylase associated protein.